MPQALGPDMAAEAAARLSAAALECCGTLDTLLARHEALLLPVLEAHEVLEALCSWPGG
jgi:hypothetical protein